MFFEVEIDPVLNQLIDDAYRRFQFKSRTAALTKLDFVRLCIRAQCAAIIASSMRHSSTTILAVENPSNTPEGK